jgi:transposase-like protein
MTCAGMCARFEGVAIMDLREFRKLCGSLNELTGPQLKELLAALKSLDMRMQSLGAIETRREGPCACPHCGQGRTIRWGSAQSGVQRMRCVACRRTFSSTTGTAVSGIHSQAGFHQVILDMFSDRPRSCRRLGRALGFDKMTIWRSPRVSDRWRPRGSPTEDHPRPRWFRRVRTGRPGRSGREILPGPSGPCLPRNAPLEHCVMTLGHDRSTSQEGLA